MGPMISNPWKNDSLEENALLLGRKKLPNNAVDFFLNHVVQTECTTRLSSDVRAGLCAKILTFTVKYFQRLPKNKRLSITYDNGSEFSGFDTIEEQTGMVAYFAFPYHSWERGTNENTNGLMRQFFPKKSRFDNITKEYLNKVVRLINNRPRKRLKYLTPHEIFKKNCVLE